MWLGQSCKNQSCDDGKLEENNSRKQNLSCPRNFCNSTLSKNYWFPILTSDVNQQSVSFLHAWNKKKIMFWAQQSHINFNVHKLAWSSFGHNSPRKQWHFTMPPLVPPQNDVWETAQKFHTDDTSLLRSGKCVWLVKANFTRCTTNQKHYPDLGRNASSVWNFCTRFSDVISRANQRWRREMLAVFSGYDHKKSNLHASCCPHGFINKI